VSNGGVSQLADDDSITTVFDTIYNDRRVVASWVSGCMNSCIIDLVIVYIVVMHSLLQSCDQLPVNVLSLYTQQSQ